MSGPARPVVPPTESAAPTDPTTRSTVPVPSGAQAEPPLELRAGVRRLSTGLIWYGVIGIALAVVGLVALLYVGGRVGALADRVSTQVTTLVATVEDASTALKDAGATAGSFATTLDQTPDTVRQAAGTVTSVRTTLSSVQGTLGAINILGASPFGGVADQFGQISSDLEGLDTRLVALADSLGDNRAKLQSNATSLTSLGNRLGDVADQLKSGVIEDSLADVRAMVTILALVLVAWTAVPAVGALLLGLWLRRMMARPAMAAVVP
jgi:hypothetical protein